MKSFRLCSPRGSVSVVCWRALWDTLCMLCATAIPRLGEHRMFWVLQKLQRGFVAWQLLRLESFWIEAPTWAHPVFHFLSLRIVPQPAGTVGNAPFDFCRVLFASVCRRQEKAVSKIVCMTWLEQKWMQPFIEGSKDWAIYNNTRTDAKIIPRVTSILYF